jgi:hypothetical protein
MADEAVDDAVQIWLDHISAYEDRFKKWESRVEKILKRYRDETRKSTDSTAKFNILWANVQTLVPATFSRLPQPDVSRRFRDNDPVGRVAALLLERALDFEVQHYPDYRQTMKQSVSDRFLGGRGTAWARYEPHIKAVQLGEPEDGAEVTEDADEPNEELEYECAPVDYVHWKDFGHTVARTWEEVTGVWRVVYLSETAVKERFGEEIASKIPYDASPEDLKKHAKTYDLKKQAKVYEIWDKETKKAKWLSKSLKQFIDEKDDPLELEGFFPCPRPLFATLTNESLIPVPDYTLYQDQAEELDTLCDRIDGLVKALKVRGVYDASVPALARLFTEAGNNDLIPVKNWAPFAEKNGLAGAIDLIDIKPIAEALTEAYQAMEQIKNQIYEITGIADIIRGQGEASETATATQLKGQYANLRLRSMQDDTSMYATELLQLKAQIICKQFSPETIAKIASADQLTAEDQQVVPQALHLLTDRPLRSFRIEVAADTLVQLDEQSEKENRIEFLTAVGNFIEKGAEVANAAPQLAPLIGELLKFGVTGFKVGKQLEGTIDQAIDQMKEAAKSPQQKPDPEMAKVQAEQQLAQQKLQAEAQAKQQDVQLEQQKMYAEGQIRQQEMQQEAALKQREQDLAHEREIRQNENQMAFDKWKAELEAQTKIAVAEISAKATLDGAQLSAAASGADVQTPGEPGPMQNMADSVREAIQTIPDTLKSVQEGHQQILQHLSKPSKRIARKMPDGSWVAEEA